MDETRERDLNDQSNWTVRLSSSISLARAEVTKLGDENSPEVRWLVEAGELALPQFSSAMVAENSISKPPPQRRVSSKQSLRFEV